ncbi:MAG: tRNA uridine-5-carboxymethylaminomethyl(34) synthesis GTPase MnmE [Bacillota bacterium]
MDTIAAIATGNGVGGIGIVRVSGEMAFEIGEALFDGGRAFSDISANFLAHANVVANGAIIDEAMFVKMVAPKSFTRENVLEIQCHGGRVVLGQILDAVLARGARMAEPGEFTKRAFLNGRLDLSQAESVVDIINAKTSEGSKIALRQLEGRLSAQIGKAKNALIEIIAHLEASVDYPEYEIEELTNEKLSAGISTATEVVNDLLRGYSRGRLIREGVTVAITGKPNVGKSSLLNRLAGRQRAIVTEFPGTTRDIIDEYIDLNGIPVRVVDTAGIRETSDEVEKIGVALARAEVADADVVVVVLDAQTGVSSDETKMLEAIRITNKKHMIVINKIDEVAGKGEVAGELSAALADADVFQISLLTEHGVEEFVQALSAVVSDDGSPQAAEGNSVSVDGQGLAVSADASGALVTNARHKQLLDSCLRALSSAQSAIADSTPLDCIAVDLMAAAGALSEITGDSVSEDIVNEIFSKFCIGK